MEHFSNVNTLLLGEKMAPLAVTHDLPPGQKTTAFLNKFHKFNCDQHYLDARFRVNYIPSPVKTLIWSQLKWGGGVASWFFPVVNWSQWCCINLWMKDIRGSQNMLRWLGSLAWQHVRAWVCGSRGVLGEGQCRASARASVVTGASDRLQNGAWMEDGAHLEKEAQRNIPQALRSVIED